MLKGKSGLYKLISIVHRTSMKLESKFLDSLRIKAEMSRQISAGPDLCCIVTWRLVESVGRVFDPLLSSAVAVFEQVG